MKTDDDSLQKMLKAAAPVLHAMDAAPEELPPARRQQLEKLRQAAFAKAKEEQAPEPMGIREFFENLGRLLGGPRLIPVSIACALLVALGVFGIITLIPADRPMIQLAMLDTVGGMRGSAKEPAIVLQQAWDKSKLQTFSAPAEFKKWLEEWPAETRGPVVKIIYDREAGEVRVSGRCKGKPPFEKAFPVQQEKDLQTVLKAARSFVEEHVR